MSEPEGYSENIWDNRTVTREVTEGSLNKVRRTKAIPEISSMEQAIAFVQGIIDELKPWPETITVMDRAEFTKSGGLLRLASSITCELTRGQVEKMRAIRKAVHTNFDFYRARVRIPDLMLAASNGAAAFIWTPDIWEAIPRDQP